MILIHWGKTELAIDPETFALTMPKREPEFMTLSTELVRCMMRVTLAAKAHLEDKNDETARELKEALDLLEALEGEHETR